MKAKLFILSIAAGVIAFFACDSNTKNNETNDIFLDYIQWNQLATLHNDLALDPFNIAYRLNIYLKADNKDEVFEELFKGAELRVSGNEYTVQYNAVVESQMDFARTGRVVINTYGEDFSEEDSQWQITTDNNHPYIVRRGGGYGVYEMKMNTGDYNVVSKGNKKWHIQGSGVYQLYSEVGYFTDWDINVYMTQTKGNADYTSLFDEVEFELETDPSKATGGKTFYEIPLKYDIISPVIYTNKCNTYLSKTAGEERIITFNNTSLITPLDTVYYKMTKNTSNICVPLTTITGIKNGIETSRDYQ